MRRIRKIKGVDKKTPVIQERANNSNIIRKNKKRAIKISSKSNSPIIKRNSVKIDNHISNSNFYTGTIQPLWKGETVYLLGGGTSLSSFNWDGLLGKRTIAINKSLFTYPNADALYWTDSRFYVWYKRDVNKFTGLKYTIRPRRDYEGNVIVVRKGNTQGLEESRDRLAHGNNSGYAAINLAYLLGAKRIILLGYDMKNDGKRGHFHDGYPVPSTGDKVYKTQFIPSFGSIAAALKVKGVEVYNASPITALKCFPIITHDKALSFS
jgi:hypothetical protein